MKTIPYIFKMMYLYYMDIIGSKHIFCTNDMTLSIYTVSQHCFLISTKHNPLSINQTVTGIHEAKGSRQFFFNRYYLQWKQGSVPSNLESSILVPSSLFLYLIFFYLIKIYTLHCRCWHDSITYYVFGYLF